MAVGHEMLKVIYHIIKDGTEFRELDPDYVDNRRKKARILYYKEQLKKLGVDTPDDKESA